MQSVLTSCTDLKIYQISTQIDIEKIVLFYHLYIGQTLCNSYLVFVCRERRL